jgi:hypothetical protein
MPHSVNENKVRTQKIVDMFNIGDLSEVNSLFSDVSRDTFRFSLRKLF